MTTSNGQPATDKPLLEARRLVKRYHSGDVTAVDGVSLAIDPGEYVSIMGPSGSGKSTLLNLLGGLDEPTSGDVYFRGESYSRMTSLDALRSAEIGFVFQSFHLLPTLSALQNVQTPMFESRLTGAERHRRAAELLEWVGLRDRASHSPRKLSVGERQRVAIARALANKPSLLLADEPTGNLDSKTGTAVLDLFDRLHQEQGLTLVVITHGGEVADRATRRLTYRDGRVTDDSRVPPAPDCCH